MFSDGSVGVFCIFSGGGVGVLSGGGFCVFCDGGVGASSAGGGVGYASAEGIGVSSGFFEVDASPNSRRRFRA